MNDLLVAMEDVVIPGWAVWLLIFVILILVALLLIKKVWR